MHDDPSTNRKSIEYNTNVNISMLLGIKKLTALFTECPRRVIISHLRHNITKYLHDDNNVNSFLGKFIVVIFKCVYIFKVGSFTSP